MIIKSFPFFKSDKTTQNMETKLNSFLEKNAFKFATHIESPSTKKVIVSLFADPVSEGKKSSIKAKVFRATELSRLEEEVNSFLSGEVKMKFSTQSFVENSLTTIIFYE